MKDEPIRTSRNKVIIDGVDVSKCKHFKDRTCIADSLLTDMDFSEAKCELCKNCYFKQLTRKTQECDELKAKIRYMEEYIKTVENSRNEFEQENTFLKRILQGINEVSDDRQEQS